MDKSERPKASGSTLGTRTNSGSTLGTRKHVKQPHPLIAVVLGLNPILPRSRTEPAWRDGQRNTATQLGGGNQIPSTDSHVLVDNGKRKEISAADIAQLPWPIALTKDKLDSAVLVRAAALHLNGDGSAGERDIPISSSPTTRIPIRFATHATQASHLMHERSFSNPALVDVVPAELLLKVQGLRLRVGFRLRQLWLAPVVLPIKERELLWVDRNTGFRQPTSLSVERANRSRRLSAATLDDAANNPLAASLVAIRQRVTESLILGSARRKRG